MPGSLTEPKQPGQMADLMEWCAYWHAMDAFYCTEESHALHHNNRCERCM